MDAVFGLLPFFLAAQTPALTDQREAPNALSSQFSEPASQPILPPLVPWEGKSRALAVAKNDPWITPSEKTDFRVTPSYDETVAWLRKLAAAAPELKMISLGKSPEGRDIWMIVASRDKKFTPEELRKSGKAIVFAQAGIHPGKSTARTRD